MSFARRVLRSAFRRIALIAVLVVGPAHAQAPPDEASFTKAMADHFSAVLPGSRIAVAGPLSLRVTAAGAGAEFQVNLDRLWDFCGRNADRCGEAMDDFVAKASTALARAGAAATAPLDVSMLRLVLRPAAYVANLRGLLARGGAGSEPVVGLFAGDVWWMLVMDDPQSARAVSKSELDRSRLGERAAIEIGRANLQHLMPSLESVAVKPAANGVGTIQGDFYTSSRLLLDHDEWGRFASTLKGRLLVVAPDARVLVFADGGVRHAREALQLIAADFAEKSERPLSTTMFQWTPEGWKRAAR